MSGRPHSPRKASQSSIACSLFSCRLNSLWPGNANDSGNKMHFCKEVTSHISRSIDWVSCIGKGVKLCSVTTLRYLHSIHFLEILCKSAGPKLQYDRPRQVKLGMQLIMSRMVFVAVAKVFLLKFKSNILSTLSHFRRNSASVSVRRQSLRPRHVICWGRPLRMTCRLSFKLPPEKLSLFRLGIFCSASFNRNAVLGRNSTCMDVGRLSVRKFGSSTSPSKKSANLASSLQIVSSSTSKCVISFN